MMQHFTFTIYKHLSASVPKSYWKYTSILWKAVWGFLAGTLILQFGVTTEYLPWYLYSYPATQYYDGLPAQLQWSYCVATLNWSTHAVTLLWSSTQLDRWFYCVPLFHIPLTVYLNYWDIAGVCLKLIFSSSLCTIWFTSLAIIGRCLGIVATVSISRGKHQLNVFGEYEKVVFVDVCVMFMDLPTLL